jgi:predicted alpha/beta-fold hydrolase
MARKLVRKLTIAVAVIILGGFIALLVAAQSLVAAELHAVGPPPDDINAELVALARDQASPIAGWFVFGRPNYGVVLLPHGVGSDRQGMLGRARFLNRARYSVLLIDLQAHGETPGTHISFGYRESADVRDAVKNLRYRFPNKGVGVLSVSLGGASCLLGTAAVEADAVILEAVYSDLEHAVRNRLKIRMGRVGELLAPLLLWQVEPTLGVRLQELSLISAISRLRGPKLIVAGAEDLRGRDNTSRSSSVCVTSRVGLSCSSTHREIDAGGA